MTSIKALEMRARLVLCNLIHCNSADHIHKVENMRCVAKLILQALESGRSSIDLLEKQMISLEAQQLEFLKERMKSWTKT